MAEHFGDYCLSPLVTVAMSVYDGDRPEWLRSACDSVLGQSYQNIEFVVVSDGITRSDLCEVLQRYAATDQRVKLVPLNQNGGLAKALNAAIVTSTGKFIVRMDADDISPAERVERLVAFMTSNPEVDAAGSYIGEFSDEAAMSCASVITYPCLHEDMLECFLKRNPLAHASAIFRREFFQKAGMYPLFSLTNEDTLLWLNGFLAGCRFSNTPEVLYYVRHDRGNASRRVGLRKSFSDFIDRLRVIIDLGGGAADCLAAMARLALQNSPKCVYLAVRSLLIHQR